MSETELKFFQPLNEYWHYFKIILATFNVLENIYELQ